MDNAYIVHYKAIAETKEAISWILERQAELRSELVAFYKKELKEIHGALSTVGSGGAETFSKKALEAVERNFIDQWQRFYDLITPCRLNRINNGAKMFQIARVENGSKNCELKHAIDL